MMLARFTVGERGAFRQLLIELVPRTMGDAMGILVTLRGVDGGPMQEAVLGADDVERLRAALAFMIGEALR